MKKISYVRKYFFLVSLSLILFSCDSKNGTVHVFDRAAAAGFDQRELWTDLSDREELEGYNPRYSRGIHDNPEVRTFILTKNQETLVIIALDIVFLSERKCNTFRRRISRALSIPKDNILIHSTHTHSSLRTSGFSNRWKDMSTAILSSALYAYENQEEVQLSFTSSELYYSVNNRREYHDIPSETSILVVRDSSGNIIGELINFACHPVVLGPSNLQITADFPYYLRNQIEESLGGTAIFLNGNFGDKNPPPITYLRSGTFLEAEEFASSISGQLIPIISEAPITDIDAIQVHNVKTRIPVNHEGFMERQRFDIPLIGLVHPDHHYFNGMKRTNLTWVEIGPFNLITSPGESTTAHRRELENAMGFSADFYLDNTNDYFGYIIAEEEWDSAKHAESWDKSPGTELSREIIREYVELVQSQNF